MPLDLKAHAWHWRVPRLDGDRLRVDETTLAQYDEQKHPRPLPRVAQQLSSRVWRDRSRVPAGKQLKPFSCWASGTSNFPAILTTACLRNCHSRYALLDFFHRVTIWGFQLAASWPAKHGNLTRPQEASSLKV